MTNSHLGLPFIVKDIFPEYEYLFNEKAIEALSRPKTNQFTSNARDLQITADGFHNIPKAAERIVSIINDLADRGYIETSISSLSTLELCIIKTPLPIPTQYAVYLWPVLTDEGCSWLDAQGYDMSDQKDTL